MQMEKSSPGYLCWKIAWHPSARSVSQKMSCHSCEMLLHISAGSCVWRKTSHSYFDRQVTTYHCQHLQDRCNKQQRQFSWSPKLPCPLPFEYILCRSVKSLIYTVKSRPCTQGFTAALTYKVRQVITEIFNLSNQHYMYSSEFFITQSTCNITIFYIRYVTCNIKIFCITYSTCNITIFYITYSTCNIKIFCITYSTCNITIFYSHTVRAILQ